MEDVKDTAGTYQLPLVSSSAVRAHGDASGYEAAPHTHPLSIVLSILCPVAWLCACYSVEEQQEAVILQWGRFAGHAKAPGLRCDNPCGRTVVKISTRHVSKDLHNLNVVDARGNPLLVSGVVRYYFQDTVRTALEVENAASYVEDQATAVLKNVISRYPYESPEGAPSLKHESDVIGREMVDTLQARVVASGARVVSLSLSNIAYAPVISAALLKRQQATALVEARQALVQGAIDIAIEASDELSSRGHSVDDKGRAQIVSNLLTILCSDTGVHPVISMSK